MMPTTAGMVSRAAKAQRCQQDAATQVGNDQHRLAAEKVHTDAGNQSEENTGAVWERGTIRADSISLYSDSGCRTQHAFVNAATLNAEQPNLHGKSGCCTSRLHSHQNVHQTKRQKLNTCMAATEVRKDAVGYRL
ncbi:hypothetical protein [Arthrobacter sp.]|uniref:hypothetical protein n=1 Tax=Arthrobacter sp. TaxID=1667 RepID=UPI003A902160